MLTKALARANYDGCTMTLTLTQSKKRVLAPAAAWGEPAFEAWDVDPGRQLYIDIYPAASPSAVTVIKKTKEKESIRGVKINVFRNV